jgi:hypothetical protein
VLGFYALATAALGTDGAAYLDATLSGATATGAIGTLSGDATSVQLASTLGAGAVATLVASESLASFGVSAAGATGVSVANPEVLDSSTSASGVVAPFALSLLAQSSGAVGIGAVAQLADYLTTWFVGVDSAAAIATLMPDVGVAFGAFPITSDGVLGLWTLGDAALGIDAPSETLFSGVAGNGRCSSMATFVDNSVVAVTVAAPVIANPGVDVPGVAAIGQVGQLAIYSTLPLAGVVATAFAGTTATDLFVSFGQATATAYAGFLGGDMGLPMTGMWAVTACGSGSVDDPGVRLSGCVATAALGTFLSHTPSSAFALWGAPVPGGAASVAFAGLPTISLSIGTGQTAAQVAGGLAALINANAALVTAGVTARVVDNLVELHQPQPALIASTLFFTGT